MLPKLNSAKNESGQAVVLFALVFVVLCVFAAMAIDIGIVSVKKGQMQNAADAAALAGAQNLPNASAATNSAIQFAELNGIESSETTVTYPYNGDSTKIEVVCTRSVDYTFARILGFTSSSVSVRAVAEKIGIGGGTFNYTVFSGSHSDTLSINGSAYIGGSVHTNDSLRINGSSLTVTETAEAVSDIRINGSSIDIETCQASSIVLNGSNINVGNEIFSPASLLVMPDFSDSILSEAELAGNVYTGNKTYNGSNIDVDSPIYVDGDITVNGSHFSGEGIIFATGDITFNGSNLKSSSDDAVCFYSKNGDITINGSNAKLDGVIYAPNGSITMNGSYQIINGRVIGKRLLFNGSNLQIISDDGDLDCLPQMYVRLVE